MQIFELRAKVKSGKENELNQVINDLLPLFKSVADLKTQVQFTEEDGELRIEFSYGDGSDKIKELHANKSFNLLLGSVKVLCEGYTLLFPSHKTETLKSLYK